MKESPEVPSDAVIVVDDAGLLTVRIGTDPEPAATGVSNAMAIRMLARHGVELGRAITVITVYPGGHSNRQTLELDGTMHDITEPRRWGVERVLAGRATRHGGRHQSVGAAEATPPIDGRKRRRVAVIALAAAAAVTGTAAAVVVVNGSEDGAGTRDLPRVERPGESVGFARAWWSLAAPIGDLGATPSPTAPSTPAVASPTPSGSPTAPPSSGPSGPPVVTDVQAPSAPGGLTLTSRTGTSLALTWGASGDNVGVSGYDVFLNGRRIDTTSAPSTAISGLVTATTYTVAVQAVDAAGNASGRTSLAATTVDTVPPTSPGGLTLAGRTGTSLTVTWRHARDNVAVTSYAVFVGGRRVSTVQGTSATVSGLTPVTTYSIAVAALDAAGNASASATVSGTTADSIPPNGPDSITVSAQMHALDVSWSRASDNVGVTSYVVYVNGHRVTTTGELKATLGSLQPGTKYTIGVVAVDAAGNASAMTTTTARTLGAP